MKLSEIITQLQALAAARKDDPEVRLTIGNAKDTALTNDVSLRSDEDGIAIDGWVASDNEEAFMPGSDE